MKIFSFFLAVVILGLSILPCGDAKAMMPNVKDHISQELNTDTSDHQDSHQDNCSPLCICSCCSVVSVFNPTGLIEITSIENQIDHVSCYSGSLISISLPIWQPPQLV